ncbi:prominin-like protein isoform X2 [Drosophila mojavensis]|uniref:Uncharacterized protein, isoform C n=1 Tax=Drosophila mojavensis TaxID=7230 RepID=A0A0Q9X4Q3_DROMO|nr:prominin-like protein isoform X2 [Drosophila mojavensis]KRG03004.1 uncharacterized protein Dmoj_GI17429, isoform C [Drosophila mojavensis]
MADETVSSIEFTSDALPSINYTRYNSNVTYSIEPIYSKLGMGFIHDFTHALFDKYYTSNEDSPKGYVIAVDNSSSYALGPKVWANVWESLIARKAVVLVWVMFLLTVIIIVPFIAVCYFCFCCCRCHAICPPCQSASNTTKRILLSLLLIPLILGAMFGLVVAFLNDKLINNTMRDSSETMMRSNRDTCAMLQDVCLHVRHLLVDNFEELATTMSSQLFAVAEMAYKDLRTEAGLHLLEVLEDIFDNMPEALALLEQVKEMQAYLVFIGSQYRDALRGAKRDFVYVLTVWCDFFECNNIIRSNNLLYMDTSQCLHFDKLPNTSAYIEDVKNIIYEDYYRVPKSWLDRLYDEQQKFKLALDPMIPPMIRRISMLADSLESESHKICNITYRAMSNIFIRNMHSTKSFEELYDNYGRSRWYASFGLFFIMLTIVIILSYTLIAGLCIRKDNSASSCMLLAIILMFAVLSFILIISLFYFTLGLVLYPACILYDDEGRNTLHSLLETVLQKSNAVNNTEFHRPSEFATGIKKCRADQLIFEMLRDNNLYDIRRLREINIHLEESTYLQFGKLDIYFNALVFMLPKEFHHIFKLRAKYLSNYHSRTYMDVLCREIDKLDIPQFISDLRYWASNFFAESYGSYLDERMQVAYVNLLRMATDLSKYRLMGKSILQTIDQIEEHVYRIDNLITFGDNNFNKSIKILLDRLMKAQNYIEGVGSGYLNTIVDNYTDFIHGQIDTYFDMVINISLYEIGPCDHLAQIHIHNVNKICDYLVNSIH